MTLLHYITLFSLHQEVSFYYLAWLSAVIYRKVFKDCIVLNMEISVDYNTTKRMKYKQELYLNELEKVA